MLTFENAPQLGTQAIIEKLNVSISSDNNRLLDSNLSL
jgi:hypothetical protein